MTKRMHSIRGKLTRIIMMTSTAAVLLTTLGFVGSGLMKFRTRLVNDLTTISSVIAFNGTAALVSGDRHTADHVLSALHNKLSIVAAGIYDDRGKPFARYETQLKVSIPPVARPDGIYDEEGRVELFSPIRLEGVRIGTLFIASDTRDRNARVWQYLEIAAVIVMLSLLAAYGLASWLQHGFSEPIVELARVAALVSKEKSFSVRASLPRRNDGDEIGNLVVGFNTMLAELEERDRKLVLHQTQLVTTVAQRTAELTAANDELLAAKDAAEKVAAVNAQLARESALILNSATDGIIGIGLDNRPTFLNPAGARILGITLSDFQARTIHEAVHHSHDDGTPWPEEDCANTVAVRHGNPVAMKNDTFWRPDGTSFPVEYSSTPMFDEEGTPFGAVVVFRDITERRAIERLKSEFVSTVSHELRTPLTSIRGALGLLSSGLLGPVAEKGQRMLEIAVSNTDRLVRLINDILDLERIESGKVELRRGLVDSQSVVDQVRDGLQSMAEESGIRIVTEPHSGSLWGDSDRIIQTLTNLIGNAIKFSPAGTVVTLSGTAGATDFTFSVADQGRGVPDEKLDTIFQRFSQVDASDSRDKGGSGLGLAICQSIVTAHGGRIWAEKNEPAGTRLQFTIPLAVRSSAYHPTIDSDATRAAISDDSGDPSVLVVEDDADLARVMTTALQSHGLRTVHTTSGSEALLLCEQLVPNLIVLDLGLSDLDGFAVVRSLRQNPKLKHASLLVYSALDLGSADQCRLRLGATEFLTKSRCSLAEFEGHVVRLLATATKKKESQHAA